jgi:RNAse (barnase) inhibitor barstar
LPFHAALAAALSRFDLNPSVRGKLMQFEKLFKPGRPCFYIAVISKEDLDNHSRSLAQVHKNAIIRTVRGSKSKSTESFFDEISAAMQFPYYFGENWPAFRDCMTDLEWIEGNAYVILVADAIFLLSDEIIDEFRVLVRAFIDANDEWLSPNQYIPRNRPETAFHVVLQCDINELDPLSKKITSLEPI